MVMLLIDCPHAGPLRTQAPMTRTSAPRLIALVVAALSFCVIASPSTPAASAQEADPTTATITGTIWHDANLDGIRQDDETGVVPNQQIVLFGTGFSQTEVSQLTDENGMFTFEAEPGSYRVLNLSTATLSPFRRGDDPTRDSDFQPAGDTDRVSVAAGETVTIDGGIKPPPVFLEFSSFIDLDGDGWFDYGEPRGTDAFSSLQLTAVDDPAAVLSLFDELPFGQYVASVELTENFDVTIEGNGDPGWRNNHFDPETATAIVDISLADWTPSLTLGVVPRTGEVVWTNVNANDTVNPHSGAVRPLQLRVSDAYQRVQELGAVPAGAQSRVVVPFGFYSSEFTLPHGERPDVLVCDGESTPFVWSFVEAELSYEVGLLKEMTAGQTFECSVSTIQQRLGDVTCDGTRSILDASIIAQYVVGLRQHGDCGLFDPGTGFVNLSTADTNDDGVVNILDAVRVAECSVERSNTLCRQQGQ